MNPIPTATKKNKDNITLKNLENFKIGFNKKEKLCTTCKNKKLINMNYHNNDHLRLIIEYRLYIYWIDYKV